MFPRENINPATKILLSLRLSHIQFSVYQVWTSQRTSPKVLASLQSTPCSCPHHFSRSLALHRLLGFCIPEKPTSAQMRSTVFFAVVIMFAKKKCLLSLESSACDVRKRQEIIGGGGKRKEWRDLLSLARRGDAFSAEDFSFVPSFHFSFLLSLAAAWFPERARECLKIIESLLFYLWFSACRISSMASKRGRSASICKAQTQSLSQSASLSSASKGPTFSV